MPSQSFADLGVSGRVEAALAARDIVTPFPIQALVIADVLAGRDVLAQAPTGSGKTLAFGVPLVDRLSPNNRRPAALVLAPTRELASQIGEELRPLARARDLSIAVVYGGVGIEKQARRAATAHILVATPGRLEDLLERRALTLEHVGILIVDEGDRMLDMGFKPALDRIVARTRDDRQTLFFSATLDGPAGAQARDYTRNPTRHRHSPPADQHARVEHRFIHLTHEGKLEALVQELRRDRDGRKLVFVRTKRGADRLVKRLKAHDLHAVAMHGDKSQSQREKALAHFDAGRVTTLVATDVAARGIDVADVNQVINFDAPPDQDAYVHRVGRTGRAGREGAGVSFVLADQREDMRRIAAGLGLSREFEGAVGSHASARTRTARARRRGR
jgi:ATP-dependent RNA helicase RhlE